MSSDTDDSMKTSRRGFGKQLTGAVAGVTLASLAENLEGKDQRPNAKRPQVKPGLFTHDTPPPTQLIDGSLVVESYRDYGNPSQQGTRWHYRQTVDPGIAHIKILHGSGDVIYKNLDADGCAIRVDWRDRNGTAGYINVTGGTAFIIDTDKRMTPGNSGRRRRPFKFEHPGNGQDFRIESITVTNGGTTLFQVSAPPSTIAEPEEYKVMIWHVGD
jgi:hypothetical protein